MKKHEKEIEQVLLDNEKAVYKRLESTYKQAFKDVDKKYKDLQDSIDKLIRAQSENVDDEKQLEIIKSQIQSKIYQQNYQKALKEQIDSAMDVLKSKHVKTLDDYLNTMYEDGFLSQIYSLQKYGVPVLAPINHDLLVKAITFNVDDIPLSKRLYDNVNKAKRAIMDEISRGIASGMNSQDIARNIQNRMDVSYRKAKQLAQNEGHRVATDAKIDSMNASKERGADIVKVWDATFDGKTRPIHAQLDGKHAEIDGYFEYSGGQVFAPKKFGKPALDINCRCALLSVPRWDIEDTVIKRDNITGELIEAKNYADWKKKYYNVIAKVEKNTFDIESATQKLKSAMKEAEYKEYLELLNNHSDENIQRLYAKYADGISDIKYVSNGGVYSPSGNYIEFGYEDGLKYEEISKYSTLAHEYGHYFDAKMKVDVHFKEVDALNDVTRPNWFKKTVSSSDEFMEAVRKDKEHLRSAVDKETIQYLKDHDGSAGVQDAIDGLFVKSRIKWGHGESYYNRKYNNTKAMDWQKGVQTVFKGLGFDASNQTKVKNIIRQYEAASEMWANIISAHVCGGKELEFVKEYLPNSYKAMLEILKGVE